MNYQNYQGAAGKDPAVELNKTSEPVATFDGGAKRSCRKPQYHLVMVELMEAVANTRAEGDRKYAPGNWMRGGKEFFVDCLAHAIGHLMECSWDEQEDFETHLGHAACNIGFILWALKRGMVTKRDFQRAAVIVEDEKREAMNSLISEAQEKAAAQLQSQTGMLSTKSLRER
jgi:hypothetical protein